MDKEGSIYQTWIDERPRCGENLAMFSRTEFVYGTDWATNAWYDEVNDPDYDFAKPGLSSGIGHFIKVVLKDSKELWCGVSGVYVTCRYL